MKISRINNTQQTNFRGYIDKSLLNEIQTIARKDIQKSLQEANNAGKNIDIMVFHNIQSKYENIIARLALIMDKFHSNTSLMMDKTHGKRIALSNSVVNKFIMFTNKQVYIEYLDKMEEFNNELAISSKMIEQYINSKI